MTQTLLKWKRNLLIIIMINILQLQSILAADIFNVRWAQVNLTTTTDFPSRQILVPRMSRGRPPQTSPGRPLKGLFDRPGDVPIWRPGDGLKWLPGDVLIWRSRDVPVSLIPDFPRTLSGRFLEDLESTQTWTSKFFFNFSFRT